MEEKSIGKHLRDFEQTCTEFEHPETRAKAEAALIAFRQQPNPIPACCHILEFSHCDQARFQAILALREGALRNWGIMGVGAQKELQTKVIQYIFRPDMQGGLTAGQLIAVLGVLLKRGWTDASSEEHQAFFNSLEAVVQSAGSRHHRKLALQILTAVVVEFSPVTASPLGQSWEFHEQCRSTLEADFLQHFFIHAVSMAQESVPAAVHGDDGGVLLACIELLTAVLSWEFRHPSAPPVIYGAGRPMMNGLQVRPGKPWRDLLLAPEATEWLVQLLASINGQMTPLAAQARNLLVLLCCVSGDVFPTDEASSRQQLGLPSEETRTLYLRRLMMPVISWIQPARDALAYAEKVGDDQLTDACRALAAAAVVHRASGMEAAIPAGSPGCQIGALGALGELTVACIQAGGTTEEAEGSWLGQATESLLDAWVDLLMENRKGHSTGPNRAADGASAVFEVLLQACLKEVAAGAFEDEAEGEASAEASESSDREQAFMRAAALARGSTEKNLSLLSYQIHEKLAQLHSLAHSGRDPSVLLEELCWLTRMGAHSLADSNAGETPLPPLPINLACVAAAAGARPDPVEALSHALLSAAGLCLDDSMKAFASPRLMEAAVWAVARWADTYLLPIDAVSPLMGRSFGAEGGGNNVLRVLALIAVQLLGAKQWAGEVELHKVVILQLLPVIVRRRTVCVSLVQLDPWQQLVGAFAAQEDAIQQLAGPLQRGLAKAICQASIGLPNTDAINGYISHIMARVAEEITALASRGDLASISGRPDVARRVDALISILRGAAHGCTPKAQPPLWGMMRAVIGPLSTVAEAFHIDAGITCMLLKLAGEVVEAHVSYSSAADVKALCEWVLQLLRQYRKHKEGQVSVASAKRLRDDAATETYRDLRALLKLLTHLTQRDQLEFQPTESAANGHPVDVAQVVFLGLDILVPLMQDDQLKFPKLARDYFTLLSYMLEVYPERLAGLPEAQIGPIMGTLRWGMQATDLDVAQPSMEALAALARYHASALAAANQQGVPALLQGQLGGFLGVVLQRILMEEDWRDLIDAAADCLLPLILTHQATFQQLGGQLVASQPTEAHRVKVAEALQELMGSNGVTSDLERANRRRFRSNLGAFVACARELVRTQ